MKSYYDFMYVVDWGNGYLGGFSPDDFTQTFNGPKSMMYDDLKMYGVKNIQIITPKELDELRGYHKPSLQEYLGV